jgi:hypothetical protein
MTIYLNLYLLNINYQNYYYNVIIYEFLHNNLDKYISDINIISISV